VKYAKIRDFYDKLKKKFQLSIFNESTLESFFSLRVSRLDGIFLLASVFILFFFVSVLLIRYTPLGAFMPRYMEPDVKNKLVMDATRVDSLTEVIAKQTKYINVIKGIIAGEIPADSTDAQGRQIPIDTLANHHLELMKTTQTEKAFRDNYEEQERYNLSTLNVQEKKSVLLFYPPVKGQVRTAFNPGSKKYGMDIQVTDRQAVLSALSGTVLYAGYDPTFKYVIVVQHTDDYVSIYRYNTQLLKGQGDVVKAGEAIAIAGRAEGNQKPHVYFELWQKGIPQNPQESIIF